MVGLRRRGLLAAGGLALLSGCGDDDDGAPLRAGEAPGGDSTLADAALLNDLLAAELAAARVLPSSRARARALEAEIRRLEVEPRPIEDTTPPRTAEAAANGLVALYVDVLAKLAEPPLRRRVAQIFAGAATALATVRERAGEEPAPEAFVAGEAP